MLRFARLAPCDKTFTVAFPAVPPAISAIAEPAPSQLTVRVAFVPPIILIADVPVSAPPVLEVTVKVAGAESTDPIVN
jgi:hypothetical protein